ETKLDAMARLGARIDKVEYDRWWEALESSSYPETEGVFIHPVQDERVMAGNGTIGLELLEDLPAPDAVLVPFGGGGLSVGIASAVKALRPEARVYAVEPEPGAPLTAAFASGEPEPIDYRPSFVDGAGAPMVLPEMWPRAREALDGAFAVSLDETAAAVRLLAERARVVAEGAGALAAARARWRPGGHVRGCGPGHADRRRRRARARARHGGVRRVRRDLRGRKPWPGDAAARLGRRAPGFGAAAQLPAHRPLRRPADADGQRRPGVPLPGHRRGRLHRAHPVLRDHRPGPRRRPQ